MTKKKNWIKLVLTLIISIIVSFILTYYSVIDVEKIRKFGSDFQYNVISTSAIIGGFLFTGISILISTIDKERIKRLWEHNYLDNLYRSAFVGMVSNIITIIIAIAYLCLNLCNHENVERILIMIEIIGLIVGIVFFSWCIKKLISIISKLKKQ